MLVAPQSAAGSHRHGGQTYFFCSAHCLAKFQEEPARFIAASLDLPKETSEESSANAGGYTCPMHPEIRHRSLNMFTLIGLGVAVAYLYSLIAELFPAMFPASFRSELGEVPVYFEAAAVIVTLILLGHVLELKARCGIGFWAPGAAVVWASGGSWGGQCLSLGLYVRGMGAPRGAPAAGGG
jgi:YHS domain-containing protein